MTAIGEQCAQLLRDQLQRQDISQAMLAAHLQISQKHLSQVLTGKAGMSDRLWEDAAQALGFSWAVSMEPNEAAPELVAEHRAPKTDDGRQRQHGTRSGYTAGCRCLECTEANRVYHSVLRARLRERGVPEGQHGTKSAYDNYACRCAECVRANTDSWRRYRHQKGAPKP